MGDYELYHASTRKHKYIKKIGDRYFYTQQEIAAYLKEKKKDITFEKGTTSDYDAIDLNTMTAPKMKDYHLDFNKQKGSYTYKDENGKTHKQDYTMSDKIGVKVGNKKIKFYNTTNRKWEKNPDVKQDNKGRFRRSYAEDGSEYTLDYSDRKTFAKREKAELKKKKQIVKNLKEAGWDSSAAEADVKSTEAYLKRKENARNKRKKVKKTVSNAAKKPVKTLRSQTSKGKKALKKFYKNNINPGVTVTYDEAVIK